MENSKPELEVFYTDKENKKIILSKGNEEDGYSYFEVDMADGINQEINEDSLHIIDDIFDYIEEHDIKVGNLQQKNITTSRNVNEKIK